MKHAIFIMFVASATISAAQESTPDSIVSSQMLNEITVKGEKPIIRGNEGIISVDLPAIVKDKPVTSILEALQYLPGVSSSDGTIGLIGASSLSIILNGKPTNMPLSNLYQLLNTLPVDRLKNIEIMYSAPAKYHVSGAAINIVLKTPKPIDGLMGQTSVGYTQNHYSSYSTGVGATYATGKWSFDLNWNISRNNTYNRQETLSNHLLNNQRHSIMDNMRQTTRNWTNLIYASIVYNGIKISYNGQIISGIRNRSLSDGTFGSYNNTYKGMKPSEFHNINVRYDTHFGLSIAGDYTDYHEFRRQNLFREQEEKVHATNRQKINRYHIYADQTHQIGQWQLNYGAEYQHSNDKSRQNFMLPQRDGFDNTLKEDIANIYTGTQASFQWGLSFSASLAAEYSHSKYRHSWNLIPQIGATYYTNPASIFQFNFTTERIYPSYWELHGGTSYISDYASILGNPLLQPYMNYSGQFNYIFRQKYAITLYYLYDDDYAIQLPYQSSESLHLIFQTINLDYSRSIGLQLHLPFNICNTWNATGTINVYNRRVKASHFHNLSFDNHRWGIYTSINNTFRFSSDCPVSLSLDASYIAGQIQGAGQFDPMWKVDAGFKWQFGKKRCCELNLKMNDILNTCNPDLKIKTAGQDYRLKAHEMNRNLRISFSWRFNGFEPKDNNPDTSRFGMEN